MPDLLPLLRCNASLRVEVKDRSGVLAMIRFNHLTPPFDNPAVRRALLGCIDQAEYMTAVMRDYRSLWKDGVGFFLPGSPEASDAGLSILTGSRDLGNAKSDLAAAGCKGERVVLMVPDDFPSLNAMSEVAADMFRKVGIDLDYQTMDWSTESQCLSSKEPVEKGGWSAYASFIPGVIATSPPRSPSSAG